MRYVCDACGRGWRSPAYRDVHKCAAETPARYRPTVRTCLRCGSEFMSRWVGNRMCRPCARDDDRAMRP
jgi:hypothetical protein